jgi:hypothetical protein
VRRRIGSEHGLAKPLAGVLPLPANFAYYGERAAQTDLARQALHDVRIAHEHEPHELAKRLDILAEGTG